MRDATFGVQLAYARSNVEPGVLPRLSVTDTASGQTILTLELTAGELAELLSSMHVGVRGKIAEPENLNRVGLGMEMQSENISFTSPLYTTSGDLARERAEKFRVAEGWDTAEVHKTNSGWRIIWRRWA